MSDQRNISTQNEQIVSTKSVLRQRLEFLEHQIYISWMRDQDKTAELQEIISILANIKSTSLESYFDNNSSDLAYFITKFSKEVTANILRQPIVFGDGGDEHALLVLVEFLKLAVSLCDNGQYAALFENIKEILDPQKSYFKGHAYMNQRYSNPKKQYSADKFNEMLPKKLNLKEYQIGQKVDVLIDNKRVYHHMNDKKVWVRGVIEEITDEHYAVYTIEHNTLLFDKTSLDIADEGSMTPDYNWRVNLNLWDVVDGHDRGKWYPATIVKVYKEEINGLMKVEYTLGFRLYVDKFPAYHEYSKYWNQKTSSISVDKQGRKYIGDFETMDENISYCSKRMQPFLSQLVEKADLDHESSHIDEKIEYEYEEINTSGQLMKRKTRIVGKGIGFSFYYALLLKSFGDQGGFDLMIEKLKSSINSDAIHCCFFIFSQSFNYFHRSFLAEIGNELYNISRAYFQELSNGEVKNVKKDTVDLISKLLRQFVVSDKKNAHFLDELEEFSISCSVKFLKSSSLEKRIQAIKTMVDLIKGSKGNEKKTIRVLDLIEENKVFEEIFGPNSHIQLINKSQELLEIMIKEDKLSDKEFELIWSGTNKGDLEGKLTILKLFKDLSKVMKNKHLEMLLKNIYSTKQSDLLNDEIEVSTYYNILF
jgi:hypothetical protein